MGERRVTIVGMGLMGASMAEGLTRKGYRVSGVDIDRRALDYCTTKGIIERGYESPEEILGETDLLIMAIYPKGMIKFIEKYRGEFKKGLVLTDICGIKLSFVDEVQKLMPQGCQFVGAHPMAGRERVGAEHGDPEIFVGANFIVTPTERNTEEGIAAVEEIARDLSFGRISRLSPARHDNMVAFTSQLTHAIAVALVNSDRDEDTYSFTGDSYRELTRIAMINEELWSELFLENRENLIGKIEDFQEKLEVIKGALLSGEGEILKREFINSTARRKQLREKRNEVDL